MVEALEEDVTTLNRSGWISFMHLNTAVFPHSPFKNHSKNNAPWKKRMCANELIFCTLEVIDNVQKKKIVLPK